MTSPEPNLCLAKPRNFQIGETAHHWTLLSFWNGPQYPKIMALAQCDCGSPPRLVQLQNIANGASTNCGCLRKKALTKHGLSGHPLYRVWLNMIARCTNETHPAYERYGKCGVSICRRWLSLESFISDMEPNFYPGLEIDRIDNDSGYEPGNCRWATTTVQNRNRGTTIFTEYQGKTLALREWSTRLNIPYQRLFWRYKQGWRAEMLFDPKDKRK